jgi:hypothetical protein
MTSKRENVPVVAVLTGNKTEFDRYIYEKKLIGSKEHYVYIGDGNRLQGTRFDSFDVLGTFMDRPNAQEIYELVKMRTGHPAAVKDKDKSYQKMSALSRKALESITKQVYEKSYDKWATSNPLIPTMKDDPDFATPPKQKTYLGPGTVYPEEAVWNAAIKEWEKQDQMVPQGTEKIEPEPGQSLSKTYIDMVTTSEDAECLNRSLNILFPEEDNNE